MNLLHSANQIRPTGMQAMMDYWERFHPINAVHVAEISQACSQDGLQTAVRRLFGKFLAADASQGWPMLTGDRDSIDRDITVQFCILPEASGHPLESLITDQLNRPFSDNELPIRVGLAHGRHSRYLWMSYRHAVADGRSVSLLMQNLLEELSWGSTGELPLLVERKRCSVSDLFPQKSRGAAGLRSVISSLKSLWSVGRCHRQHPVDPNSFRMSFQVHAEQLSLAALQRQAKSWMVSIGELVLAAMLEWFLQQDSSEPHSVWAPSRCLSVLVDLRGRAASKPLQQFGQYLSPVNITANYRRHVTFEDLLHQVRGKACSASAVANSLDSLRGLLFNSSLVRRMPRAFANRYQEFLLPVSGALSNVNLNTVLPPPRSDVSVANYLRGTCATQLSPMILCLTTIRDTCTLTTTHRDAVYSAEEMRSLVHWVMRRAFGIHTIAQNHAADWRRTA